VPLALALLAASPASPPSRAAALRTPPEPKALGPFLKEFVVLATDVPALRALGVGYGLVVGASFAYPTMLAVCLPNGTSEAALSAVGGAYAVAAVAGALFGGVVLDSCPTAHKGVHVTLALVAAASVAAVAALVELAPGNVPAFAAACAALGFSTAAVNSAGFEWAAALSYPCPESTTGVAIQILGAIGGVVLVLAAERVQKMANIAFAAAILAAALLFATVRDKRRRPTDRGAPGAESPGGAVV